MRSKWTLKNGIAVHRFVFAEPMERLMCVTEWDRMAARLVERRLPWMGSLVIENLKKSVKSWKGRYDTVTVAVVLRDPGVAFYETETGLPLCNRCFTLWNDKTAFNPDIIERVLNVLDWETFGVAYVDFCRATGHMDRIDGRKVEGGYVRPPEWGPMREGEE